VDLLPLIDLKSDNKTLLSIVSNPDKIIIGEKKYFPLAFRFQPLGEIFFHIIFDTPISDFVDLMEIDEVVISLYDVKHCKLKERYSFQIESCTTVGLYNLSLCNPQPYYGE